MANRVSPCSCSYAPASLAPGAYACFSGRRLPAHIPQACRRARTLAAAALHAPEHLQDLLPPLVDHLTMAYERVTLPCHSMGCGDYVHRRRAPRTPGFIAGTRAAGASPATRSRPRAAAAARDLITRCARPRSTLDPVLRLEHKGITPQGLALVSAVLAYLFARPGAISRARAVMRAAVKSRGSRRPGASVSLQAVLCGVFTAGLGAQACWKARWTTTYLTSSSAW